ncbi:MAG: methyltransferase modification enzyme [Betaproteobacteria bacterium]|nr:methyltransferase modification enzyme [Betaproteobacteria bacterium]
MLNVQHLQKSRTLRTSSQPRNDLKKTREKAVNEIPVFEQELWTSKQRQANSIHEVSYRACFKPQLPAYFIGQLTHEGDAVYDPFSGRGTTAVEAALRGRRVIANDINPLSEILTRPRLEVPTVSEIDKRLRELHFSATVATDIDLSMFFHQNTLNEILGLRRYLAQRHRAGHEDHVDRWIRMVATNRLTGHSPGFFSVYTLPPNQAVSPENQIKINQKLDQTPSYKDVRALILRKSMQLQGGIAAADRWRLRTAAESAHFLTGGAAATKEIESNSVQLTVTSPPFLDVVQYAKDNWLRCWFNNLDAEAIAAGITMSRTVEEWDGRMAPVFSELYRITKPGGWVAFEVGEVRKGKIRLEERVAPLGTEAGFVCEAILINAQRFTKTANIWGVGNNEAGTNSNRIVIFRKAAP